jgi:predicted ATP-dependent endonuclease of OLD family
MTAFTDIYDDALMVMQDYTLDNLANTNYNAFLTFMKGLLETGIPFFNCCLNSLEYQDVEEEEEDEYGDTVTVTNTYFTSNLTTKEKSILAMCIVYQWFKRDVNDSRQFRQKLNTRDFKTESSYQSLQKRSEHLDKLKEQICQEIQNYQIENMDALYEKYGGL